MVGKQGTFMAKNRTSKRKSKTRQSSSSSSLLDASALKSFVESPTGRQLMADVIMATAGVAAAALLASNRGGKAMGKAAMQTAQNAVLGIIANATESRR
jgi:hypothetical protein